VTPLSSRTRQALAAALLAALVVFAFRGVAGLGFIEEYDDYQYVTRNPAVAAGLSAAGVRWAFGSVGYAYNWHPLTWVSHMADVSLFGLRPAGHHLVNLALHAASAALALLVLSRATGALWPAAAAAALFAVHPLRVESVAWVAERKDVLAVFLGLLTTAAHLRYARRPAAGRHAAVVALFALGLLAKPSLVALPACLLVLDWWPLNRLRRGAPAGERPAAGFSAAALLLEKAPLALLAAGSAALTFVAQRRGGAMAAAIPPAWRVENALVSCVRYLGDTAWPRGLAVFYPYPAGGVPAWQWAGAAAALAAISAAAVWARRRHPALLAGWLWYLATLAPVLGLVQVGEQAAADRYTYLPHLGLAVALAWGARDLGRRLPPLARVLPALAAAALVALVALTGRQIGVWRDGVTLFTHALAVNRDVWIAENNLGLYYLGRGDRDRALAHFREAVRIKPGHARSRYNLAVVLLELGDLPRAEEQFRAAVALDPGDAEAHANLGVVLMRRGAADEAIVHFREAVRLDPGDALAADHLRRALLARGGR
jgi:tetratricopeptide (TPR) repeat protein